LHQANDGLVGIFCLSSLEGIIELLENQ
jgi:hypothetical protein